MPSNGSAHPPASPSPAPAPAPAAHPAGRMRITTHADSLPGSPMQPSTTAQAAAHGTPTGAGSASTVSTPVGVGVAAGGSRPSTPHASLPLPLPLPAAAAWLTTGGALTYHLILKKHKLLPRSFPVEMRCSSDFRTLLISSDTVHPLTLAPLPAPVAGQPAPSESLPVNASDVIDCCEGAFDVASALMEKHMRKTQAGFAPERSFTLFLSHVEHTDKRAQYYAQSTHHYSQALAGMPIPFYFEANTVETMRAWVRALRWLKEHTAAAAPDERRAQLVKLHRHSAIRSLHSASQAAPPTDTPTSTAQASTVPLHPGLTHSQSLQQLSSTSPSPAAAAASAAAPGLLPPSPQLTHSVSSSAFSFMKRAFSSQSPSSTTGSAAMANVVAAAQARESPYRSRHAQLRRLQITVPDKAEDELDQPLSPATSRVSVASTSSGSHGLPPTPSQPSHPTPLRVEVGSSSLPSMTRSSSSSTPMPYTPHGGSIISPSTSARHTAQKTEMLTSLLTAGQAFLYYPSRSLTSLPEIMYLWCSPDLNSIGWGPDRNKRPLHSYPSSCLKRLETGVSCEIFGLAKWGFSVVLRVNKAQDQPKEHGRHDSGTMPATPASQSQSQSQSQLHVPGTPTLPTPVAASSTPGALFPMLPPSVKEKRSMFDALRSRRPSWSGGAAAADAAAAAAAASSSAGSSSAAVVAPTPSSSSSSGSSTLLTLHFAAATSATLSLWIYALKWLRDSKSNVSTPFNVQRVSWMDTDLRWGGENLMATFGLQEREKLVQLGGGGMANVYLVTHQGTRQQFALKVFHHYPETIRREIEIMRSLRHKNCIEYYGCIPRGRELYVIMEYADGGSLADLIKRSREKMIERHIAYVLRQVLHALHYLHSLSILHRDIKAANILLTSKGLVKLTDFGISEHYFTPVASGAPAATPSGTPSPALGTLASPGTATPSATGIATPAPGHKSIPHPDSSPIPSSNVSAIAAAAEAATAAAIAAATSSPCVGQPAGGRSGGQAGAGIGGSPLWMSPEALRGHELSPAADVYSLGITALEIAEGKPPNSECKTLFAVMHAVLQSPPPTLLAHARSYPNPTPEFCDFVDRCVARDPQARWTVDQLLAHPFITQEVADSAAQASSSSSGVVSTARSFLQRSAALLTSPFSKDPTAGPSAGPSAIPARLNGSGSSASNSNSPYTSRSGSPTLGPQGSSPRKLPSVHALFGLLPPPKMGTAEASPVPSPTPAPVASPAGVTSGGTSAVQVSWPAWLPPTAPPPLSLGSARGSGSRSGCATPSGAGFGANPSLGGGVAAIPSPGVLLGASGVTPGSAAAQMLVVRSAGSSPHLSPSSSFTTLNSLSVDASAAPLVSPPAPAVPVPVADDVPEESFTSYLQYGTYTRAKLGNKLGSGERKSSISGSLIPGAAATASATASSTTAAAAGSVPLRDASSTPVATDTPHRDPSQPNALCVPTPSSSTGGFMSILRAVSPMHHGISSSSGSSAASAASPSVSRAGSVTGTTEEPKVEVKKRRSIFSRIAAPASSSATSSTTGNPSDSQSGSTTTPPAGAPPAPAVLKKQPRELHLLVETAKPSAPPPHPHKSKEESRPSAEHVAASAGGSHAPSRSRHSHGSHHAHGARGHTRHFSALPKLLPKLTLKRTASMSTVAAFEQATLSSPEGSGKSSFSGGEESKRYATFSPSGVLSPSSTSAAAAAHALSPPSVRRQHTASPNSHLQSMIVEEGDEDGADRSSTSRHRDDTSRLGVYNGSHSDLRQLSAGATDVSVGPQRAKGLHMRRYSSAVVGPPAHHRGVSEWEEEQDMLARRRDGAERDGEEGSAFYDDNDNEAEAEGGASPDMSQRSSRKVSSAMDGGGHADSDNLAAPPLLRERSRSRSPLPVSPPFRTPFSPPSFKPPPLLITSRESVERSDASCIMLPGKDDDAAAAVITASPSPSPTSIRKPRLKLQLGMSTASEGSSIPLLNDSAEPADMISPKGADPFSMERQMLFSSSRGTGSDSLTQGDGGAPMDMNQSYVISSHGTLIAGNFAISAQGLHHAKGGATSAVGAGASGPASRTHSSFNSSRRRNNSAENPPRGPIAIGGGADAVASPHPAADNDETASTSLTSSNETGLSPSPSDSDPNHHYLSKSDLFTLGVIGRGQNGAVLKAIHLPSLTRVALKTIHAHDRGTRHQLLHELTAYLSFDSPFLVSFLGAYYEHDLIVLATEYMDKSSLQSFIRKHGPLSGRTDVFRQIAFQCIAGLRHMHANHALHRDIKPDNVLLDHDARTKLADFGLLKELGTTLAVSHTFLGTMSYLSPERITSNAYSYASDVWSMGLTFRYALTGVAPPTNSDYFTMLDLITRHPPKPLVPSDADPPYTPELCDFVNGMLSLDMHKRYTCEELLLHPFLLGREEDNKQALESEEALMDAFERSIPQTQLPSHPDSALWAVGEDNLADLDLILERIIKEHLLPELAAAVRRRPSVIALSPAASAALLASPMGSSATGSCTESNGSPHLTALAGEGTGDAIATSSDGAYTTSMHHAPARDTGELSDVPSALLSLPMPEVAPVAVFSDGSDTSPVVPSMVAALDSVELPPSVLSVSPPTSSSNDDGSCSPPLSLQRIILERTRSLNNWRVHSADAADAASGDREAEETQATWPSVEPVATSPASASDSTSPDVAFHEGDAQEPDDAGLEAGAGAPNTHVRLAEHEEEGGDTTTAEQAQSTPTPTADLAPAEVAMVPMYESAVDEDASTAPPSPSSTSPSVSPPRFGGPGLTLRITAHESVEQAGSPIIDVLPASTAPSAPDVPLQGDFLTTPVRPRLGLSLGKGVCVEEDSGEDSVIHTFSSAPSGSEGGSGDEAVVASPMSAMLLSPMDAGVLAGGMELLQLDADRCECLGRQFALTPDQVQAKFLAKQREMLRRSGMPSLTTPH